jgi:hypothetical protein
MSKKEIIGCIVAATVLILYTWLYYMSIFVWKSEW